MKPSELTWKLDELMVEYDVEDDRVLIDDYDKFTVVNGSEIEDLMDILITIKIQRQLRKEEQDD